MLLRYTENAVLYFKPTFTVCFVDVQRSLFLDLFESIIARYHSKNAPDFLTKMNNIVWSCCVLHNLLLGYDGLDKLWTKEDYLSTWCA